MTISPFGALILSDPATARARILEALETARGERTAAARALGLATPRTLYRWIERLGMWPEVDALVASHGFDDLPGPPRRKTKFAAALSKCKGNVERAARRLGMKPERFRRELRRVNLNAEEEGKPTT